MRRAREDIWSAVHAERRRLVADLADLDDERWTTASLCPGWTVHDVVAHLVDTARTGRMGFLREMLRARMDFDRANETGIAREKRSDPQQTLAALHDSADLTRTPPANLATRLVEAIVHGEDIRRPLGLRGTYPPAAIAQAISYQVKAPVGFGGGRERAEGIRLVDQDSGVSWGTGTGPRSAIEAPALDLLLAISGRPVDTVSLDAAVRGEGVGDR